MVHPTVLCGNCFLNALFLCMAIQNPVLAFTTRRRRAKKTIATWQRAYANALSQTRSTGTTLPKFPLLPASLARRAERLSRPIAGGLSVLALLLNLGTGTSGGLGWLSPGACNDAALTPSPFSRSSESSMYQTGAGGGFRSSSGFRSDERVLVILSLAACRGDLTPPILLLMSRP